MTPEEIICTFMEPRPSDSIEDFLSYRGRWWAPCAGSFIPVLDACREVEELGYLHEVEERLNRNQWINYVKELLVVANEHPEQEPILGPRKAMIHASSEQKAIALAYVLRDSVEGQKASAE